jgi:DNA repair protein RecO
LRKSLRALHLGLYAAELAGRLIEEHDVHLELFDKLVAVLPQLASGRREEMFLAFALDLLRESGYLPELLACVSCGTATADWPRAWFSVSRSGIVCRNCEATIHDRRELDIRLLRLLQTLLRVPRLPQLTRHQTDPLNRLLADHVEQTLGRPLRMRRYVLNE